MKILNKILKSIGYDPDEQAGNFGSSGKRITGETNPEPNGYESNANTAGEVNTGTDNTIETGYGVEADIHEFHVDAVQNLLGNPSVTRPAKNNFRNIDRELESQYFNDMERR